VRESAPAAAAAQGAAAREPELDLVGEDRAHSATARHLRAPRAESVPGDQRVLMGRISWDGVDTQALRKLAPWRSSC
jgi:hypothetical protein